MSHTVRFDEIILLISCFHCLARLKFLFCEKLQVNALKMFSWTAAQALLNSEVGLAKDL